MLTPKTYVSYYNVVMIVASGSKWWHTLLGCSPLIPFWCTTAQQHSGNIHWQAGRVTLSFLHLCCHGRCRTPACISFDIRFWVVCFQFLFFYFYFSFFPFFRNFLDVLALAVGLCVNDKILIIKFLFHYFIVVDITFGFNTQNHYPLILSHGG